MLHGKRVYELLYKKPPVWQACKAVMQREMAGAALAGLRAGQFGARLGQGGLYIEEFQLQLLPQRYLVRQCHFKLVQS